jgi:alpha-beta hydrolase superfamily lysophospholipase
VKHHEGSLAGCRGRKIYFQCWQPDQSPRALLLVAHGAGEHSGRYQPLAQFFSAHGYAVAVVDHNGHGHSEGIPGHVESFDDYLTDLRSFHLHMATHFAGLPVFLLGHSHGGLISSLYLLRYQSEFSGCILSGPAIKSEMEPGALQMWLIRLLAALAPKLGVIQLDAKGVSRDPEEVRKYEEDPLVHHGKMTVGKVHAMFGAMKTIEAKASSLSLPMLLLHGGKDAMTAPEGSRFLYRNVGSTDKTLKIYPGLFHEIFNEPEREEVLGDVLNWCDERMPGS